MVSRYLTTKIIQIVLQCSIVSLTVCDLSRLKSAILVPEAMHTVTNSRVKTASSLQQALYSHSPSSWCSASSWRVWRWPWCCEKGRPRPPVRSRRTSAWRCDEEKIFLILPKNICYLEVECEVFPLVCVGDVEGLGGAVLLGAEVELLHVLLGGADTDEGTQLGPCNNQ